jgi:hypothetical protein
MQPVWARSILRVMWLPLRFMRSMYDLEVWFRKRHHVDPVAPRSEPADASTLQHRPVETDGPPKAKGPTSLPRS